MLDGLLGRSRPVLALATLLAAGAAAVAAPALGGDAGAAASSPWLTNGNSLSAGFLGTANAFPLVLRTNNAERLRITPSGSVGIGTSSPADPLSVQTPAGRYGVTHTDGVATVGTWVGPGNGGVPESGWLGTKTNSPLQFFTGGGSSEMTINTNGNVGVGTTAPATKLSVQTPTNSYGLTQTDGAATVGTWVGNGCCGVPESGWLGTKSNHPLQLFTADGRPSMSIATNGKVSIGTVSSNGTAVYDARLSVDSRDYNAAIQANSYSYASAIVATSKSGAAVSATASSGPGIRASSTSGDAIKATSSDSHAIEATSSSEAGVIGETDDPGGAYPGVWGIGPGVGYDWAGYFSGDIRVEGNVISGRALTLADDPRDPANAELASTPVNASAMLNVFSGNVTTDAKGEAVVQLPGYFEATNTDPRYQLTVVGQFAQAIVAREIKDNRFMIRTDKPDVKVSWQVTGVRSDPYAKTHPFQADRAKPASERGKYYDPQAYGQPASAAIGPDTSHPGTAVFPAPSP